MPELLENRNLIGLSLSACVWDIVSGRIREDQVIRVETSARIDGFRKDFQYRKNLLTGAGLPTASKVQDEIITELAEQGNEDRIIRWVEVTREKETARAVLGHSWDLLHGYPMQRSLRDRYVSAKEFKGCSWEDYFAEQKKSGIWTSNGHYDECAEVATRLIEAGKVRSYENNCTASGRWVDADTGEFISNQTLFKETGKEYPPEYVLRILELRGKTDGVAVTSRG